MTQAAPPAAGAPEKTIKVVEMGKPAQRCKILKSWTTPEGNQAYEVKAIDTDEVMTIVETQQISASAGNGGKIRAVATRIWHWGPGHLPPQGSPTPPAYCSNGSCTSSPADTGTKVTSRLTPVPAEQGYRKMQTGARVEAPPSPAVPTVIQPHPVVTASAVVAEKPATPAAESVTEILPRDKVCSSTPQAPTPAAESVTQILPHPLYPPVPKAALKTAPPVAAATGPEKKTAQTSTAVVAPRPVVAPAVVAAPSVQTMPTGPASPYLTVQPMQGEARPPAVVATPSVQTVPTGAASPYLAVQVSPMKVEAAPPAVAAVQPPATTQHLSAPLTLPTRVEAGPAVVEASPTVPTPIVVKEKPKESVQPVKPAAQDFLPATSPKASATLPGDYRESWGKPVNAPSSMTTNPLPQAKSASTDPLVNPESLGKPLNAKAAPQVAVWNGNKPEQADIQTAADAAQTTTPAVQEVQPKKRWTLFGGWSSKPGDGESRMTQTVEVNSRPAASLEMASMPANRPGAVHQTGMAAAPAMASMPASRQGAVYQSGMAAAPVGGDAPLGVQSVNSATSGVQGPVRYVPVPVVTLPGTTAPPSARLPLPPAPRMPDPPQPNQPQGLLANAFTPSPSPIQYGRGPYNGMAVNAWNSGQPNPMTGVPYGPMGPNGMYQAPMAAAARPGTVPGYPRYPNGQPYPNAQAYPPGQAMAAGNPQLARAMQQGTYGPGQGMAPTNRGVMPVSYNQVVQAAQPADTIQSHVAQMLTTLRDSIYPSQRELAADDLAVCNWKTQPQVVQALMATASKDPAATVRAGCVRSLTKMGAATAPVIAAVQSLKNDPDPRVRIAAEEALGTLVPVK
jgi:hypothetical protein